MKRSKILFLVAGAVMIMAQPAFAGTIGHYYPGVMGLRDIILPPKGLYALCYAPFYFSDDYMNSNGNSSGEVTTSAQETKVINVRGHQIPVTLSGDLTVDTDMSTNFAMQELLLVWTPGWKFLGADYGMMIVPAMGYVGVEIEAKAHATGTIRIGNLSRTVTKDGTVKVKSETYGFADLLIQPVMLDWRGKRHDVGFNYGFFAPTGAYSEDRIANVGMGFWTQQFQAFGAYYLNDHRSTVATLTMTYNLNSKMYDQDLTPGQSIALEYGIGHYVNERVEVAACGYNQWQISSDAGTAAKSKDVWYQINAVGGQVTGWVIKEKMNITAKCMYEYYGVDRFRGILSTVNLTWVF